jgi:hypothetical protein
VTNVSGGFTGQLPGQRRRVGLDATRYPPGMRIGIFLSYAGGFAETVVELAD